MQTISHRELRNNSAEVLRRVAEGESFMVSNRGVVVARLSPPATPAFSFPVSRPAKRAGAWAELPKLALGKTVSSIIDEEREDR